MRAPYRSDTVSVLTLSARIAESGAITLLPEKTEPVAWTAAYADDEPWEKAAEARATQEAQPLLDELETARPPADTAHRWPSVDGWRAATARAVRRDVRDRVVEEMRRAALAAIDARGPALRPVRWWEETHRAFLDHGEWTVTVCASGTDHTAVREAFTAGLPGRRDEILADAQNRIPRRKGKTIRLSPDTPEKVRRDWRRDRRNGTAPKPAKTAFALGSWVTWTHPATGETCTGVVTGWLPEHRSDDFPRHARTVFPADGGEPLVLWLQPQGKPSQGPWIVAYTTGQSSTAQPGAAPG